MNAEFGSLTVRTAIDAASFGYDLLYSYTVRAPLAEKIRALGHKEAYYFPSFQEIEKFVLENCRKNDVLITMGAGNVNTVAKDLLS